MRRIAGGTAALLLALAAGACQHTRPGMEASMPAGQMGAGAGWRSLIDDSMSAWRGYRAQTLPAGWRVADGVLTKEAERADIVSREQFGDFELALDWRLSRGGNAGIFYRATEEYDHIYWSGPEYQLLDDGNHPDSRRRETSAGAAYALYPAPAGVVKAAGEWNATRIVVRGTHVEHWLNGQRLVEYELGSADWLARVAKEKFVEWPGYGRARRGHVAIQGDHEGTLSIRNMRIRDLK